MSNTSDKRESIPEGVITAGIAPRTFSPAIEGFVSNADGPLTFSSKAQNTWNFAAILS